MSTNSTGSIYQRKDGRFVAQIELERHPDGRRNKKSFYGKTKREVKLKLNAFLKKGDTEEQSKRLIYELIDEWLKDFKITNLKPTSYDRLECTIRNHIKPELGNLPINKLEAIDIQKLLNKMNKEGLSYSSIKKVYNALSDFLKHSVNIGLLKNNPINAVVLPKKENTKEIKETRYFSDDEISLLKKACTEKNANGSYKTDIGYSFVFMLNTGLRLGEMLALTYADIDTEKNTVSINKTVELTQKREGTEYKKGREIIIQRPKTKNSIREIPLNQTARKAFDELKNLFYNGDDNTPVINIKGKHLNPRSYTKRFYTVLKRAGIEKTGLHTLRHTFASVLFAKKTPVKTISALLGHSSTSVTENIYIHLLPNAKEEAMIDVEI